MEIALRALLTNDVAVSDLVGQRVAWGRRGQSDSALPAIVLTMISAPREYHFKGQSDAYERRVQVDCFGETYGSAKQTAEAVAALVSGYSGTVSGVKIQRISIDSERDLPAPETDARILFVCSLDLLIWADS